MNTIDDVSEMTLADARALLLASEEMRARGAMFKRIGNWLLVKDHDLIMVFYARHVTNVNISSE